MNIETIREIINDLNYEKIPDKPYDFYYDETNNYRKVRLADVEIGFKDNKVLNDNYTLGGICIQQEKTLNTNQLITNLKLQKNQELKSKTFFKERNDFVQCIEHPKLRLILDWVLDNCYIHYLDIDAFYYSVIDIVDSICEPMIPNDLIVAIKSELYVLLRKNILDFLYLCKCTGYPNVIDTNLFCDGLINIIEQENDIAQELEYEQEEKHSFYTMEIFKQLIKAKKKTGELIFLKDNIDKTIIDSFHYFRQQRCIVFETSKHIFDDETVDEENMNNNKMFLNNGKEHKNFEFKNSKALNELQISDIIIYLISKWLKFITFTATQDIECAITEMSDNGRENTRKLLQIIDKSDLESKYFICTVIPEEMGLKRTIEYQHIKYLLDKNYI